MSSGDKALDHASDISDLSAGSAGSLNLRKSQEGTAPHSIALETTSHGAAAASAGRESAARQFETTPASVAATALGRLIKHWNVSQVTRSTMCCPLHAQLGVLIGLVNTMAAETSCKASWSIHCNWQCGACKYMNTSPSGKGG